jgi:hypothetical protein
MHVDGALERLRSADSDGREETEREHRGQRTAHDVTPVATRLLARVYMASIDAAGETKCDGLRSAAP